VENKENKWHELTSNMPKTKEDREALVKTFKSHKMDPEIAELVAEQLAETQTEDGNNIIFLFSEGDYVVTAIHVPHEAINSNGPMLMRGISDKSIIAAFSREFIREKLDFVEEEGAGLPEQMWVGELEKLVELVKFEMVTNPPASWDDMDDLLDGGK